MTIIALTGGAGKIKKIMKPGTEWCYLGKNVEKRKKISGILGEGKRFYLKDRLHLISERFRQPYIDLIAEFGKKQKNQLNWWAGKFASKSHLQTDFFLLFCYKVLAIELIRSRPEGKELIIFIEDPWLFADVKNICGGRNIKFFGITNFLFLKSFLILRGIVCRLLLLAWIIIARGLAYFYHTGKKPAALERGESAVGIINPAEPRCFKDGRYTDNYMPGLADFYREQNIPFFYIYLLRYPLSTAKYIGKNKEILWSVILDTIFFNALKRVFEYWNPVSNGISRYLGEYDIGFLLDREKKLEFSSAGFNVHLILHDTLDSFFKKKWCASVIYIFENQPWEKMLCMAARKNNIRLVGYQHSAISRFYLSQFIGKRERFFVPLPDKLITAGEHSANLYREGGMPEDKIFISGAWRYLHLIDNSASPSFRDEDFKQKPLILIALCPDIFVSKSMLENIYKSITKKGLDKKVDFWIKPHPGNTINELKKVSKLISRYPVTNESFKALLKKMDIVISSASVSGLEVFLYGKKVILYIPENMLAADPLLDIDHERIYKWYEGEDIDTGSLENIPPILDVDNLNALKAKYFSAVKREVWLNSVI